MLIVGLSLQTKEASTQRAQLEGEDDGPQNSLHRFLNRFA